jgi:hypothetical protein
MCKAAGDLKHMRHVRKQNFIIYLSELQNLQEGDNVYGCQLPPLDTGSRKCKMFQGRDFVLKHIRTRHPEAMQVRGEGGALY